MRVILILFGIFSIGFTSPMAVHQEVLPLAEKLSDITGYSTEMAVYEIFGELTFEYIRTDFPGYSCWSSLKCYGGIDPLTTDKARGLLIHELGHRFLKGLNLPYTELGMELGYYENETYIHVAGINPVTHKYERTTLGYMGETQPHIQHGLLSPDFNTYSEDFADMFMNWALDGFSDCEAGRLRMDWMDTFMRQHLLSEREVE